MINDLDYDDHAFDCWRDNKLFDGRLSDIGEIKVTLTQEERMILSAWEKGWTEGKQQLPLAVTYHDASALTAKLHLNGSPAVAHSGWLLEIHAKSAPEWTPGKIRERLIEVQGEHECKQGFKRTLRAVAAGNVTVAVDMPTFLKACEQETEQYQWDRDE
ncbi:MAG: hypothetical protein K2W95_00985 [Candidatus Obscuribacterales bacterium]|nr:hypothetical protein [Candidatus Obscuribacterales bacterium]